MAPLPRRPSRSSACSPLSCPHPGARPAFGTRGSRNRKAGPVTRGGGTSGPTRPGMTDSPSGRALYGDTRGSVVGDDDPAAGRAPVCGKAGSGGCGPGSGGMAGSRRAGR
ncbi:hypothetical protein B9W68_20645 [Streptomyces sp. CS227]|nr:hypothetical protein B9W68_20645 [Streptomyces sp. CS227]